MGISYEERNGRIYTYRCTSKRVPGKKYPVSKKEYLGVVDLETGTLIPKKVKAKSLKFTLRDGKFRAKNYGGSMIVAKVVEDISLCEDLQKSFGEATCPMLALAMSQALSPTAFMDTEIILDSSYIRELIGIVEMDLSPQRLSEITRLIGGARTCIEDFFILRAQRSPDVTFLYNLKSQYIYSEVGDFPEWVENLDGGSLNHMSIGLLTNGEGDLISFEFYSNYASDISTLIEFTESIRERVPDSIYVLDRDFENASNVAELMEHGINFILQCNVASRAVKSLITDFSKDVFKPEFDRIHNGHVYSVCERLLGVVPTTAGHLYIRDDDSRFEDCQFKVKIYVCFDSEKRSDDEQRLKAALMRKIKELDRRKFDDPAKAFIKKAGWMAKYLDCKIDDQGFMKVSYKNNAMAFFRNRAGIFVILSPTADWETVMSAYDVKGNVEKVFSSFKNKLDVGQRSTDDPDAYGRLLIKFLALTIRARMQIEVSKSKIENLSVENALISASTYKIVKDRGIKFRSEKTERVKDIFELFGVDDPEELPIQNP